MSTNRIQSAINISTGNASSGNGVVQTKNIFQLIEPIPKKIYSASGIKTKYEFLFTEYLILFLQQIHPEELEKLSFNPEIDTFNTLLSKLIEVVTDLKYKIVYNEEDETEEEFQLRILYDIKAPEWLWYLLEVCYIKKIVSEELKIGFAHFINYIREFCPHDALYGEYEDMNDNPYDMEFEMLEENEDEESEYDIHSELERLRELKKDFNFYAEQDWEIFLNYEPKNELEKEFKEFLQEIITLDYSLAQKFVPNCNVYNDGGVDFSETLCLYFDISEGIEESHYIMQNEQANNGYSEPMGWYKIHNREIKNITTQEDIDQLNYNYKMICRLYDDFLNKM